MLTHAARAPLKVIFVELTLGSGTKLLLFIQVLGYDVAQMID